MSALLDQYRWAVERLVAAFGQESVVVADGAEDGTLAIGVRDPRNSQVFGFVVERPPVADKGWPAVSLNAQADREQVVEERIRQFRARLSG